MKDAPVIEGTAITRSSLSNLLREIKHHPAHTPRLRMPAADPAGATFEKGGAVWVTKLVPMSSGRIVHPGLYRCIFDEHGRQCVVLEFERRWHPHLLSPDIIEALAPVRDLQREAVEALPKGRGWKLHLNFDYQDPLVMKTIWTILERLKKCGAIANFKIGKGGGKEAGQPGKEATVYVGHGHRARQVALFLERYASPLLLPPEGDALIDDVLQNPLIAARFDLSLSYAESEFHQYGWHGVPFLALDGRPWGLRHGELARQYAARVLAERFGEFFTAGCEGSTRPGQALS